MRYVSRYTVYDNHSDEVLVFEETVEFICQFLGCVKSTFYHRLRTQKWGRDYTVVKTICEKPVKSKHKPAGSMDASDIKPHLGRLSDEEYAALWPSRS